MALVWAAYIIPSNTLLYQLAGVEMEENKFRLIGMIFPMSIIILLWLLIYFGVHTFFHFKESEIEKWKLDAALKDAELIALKSQINPHFIFNSLNNIRSLVIEDPEKSRDMITHLSDLLRYSIQFNNQEKVTLEKEMDVTDNKNHYLICFVDSVRPSKDILALQALQKEFFFKGLRIYVGIRFG